MWALGPVVVLPPYALALPTGADVAAGDVGITTQGGQMDLTQAGAAAIVNWQDFSIGADETVRIHQDSAQAALLNRVLGANPSELLGRLQADGQVFLVNPNGVLVGEGARIDAGGFFATTARIDDADFLAGGDLSFADGSAAAIVNLGLIQAGAGDAVLVAYRVVNDGEISAPQGTAALGAATEFVYRPLGDARISVVTSAAHGTGAVGVDNAGLVEAANAELTAADGNLFALAVNQSGVVRATGVERSGGRVLLTAAGGALRVDGTVAAQRVDGSGGEVLIGGDRGGLNPAVPTAQAVEVGAGALIDVAATSAQGDGGRAIVWADDTMDFAGRIDGRGGAREGDGAFAEVSGKRVLNYQGTADLRAAGGQTGELLLDPDEAVISSATDDQANGVFNTTVLATNLATANVTVDTSTGYGNGTDQFGDITVADAVTWTSANTLTLKSGDNIAVKADLAGGAGSGLVLSPGFAGDGFSEFTDGNLTVDAAATIAAGTVTIVHNTAAAPVGAGNLPAANSGERQMGAVTINGIVQTDTLDLQLVDFGVDGDVMIANPANAIGTLASGTADGTILGSFELVDGDGDLQVTGAFANVFGEINLRTAGDLTLASGAVVSTNNFIGDSDVHLAAGGSFSNAAGANAVAVNGGGRFLIYSDNPAATALDGLPVTPVYNKTWAGNAPGSITQTGNRILYSLAPTLTFSADGQTREYGDANAALGFSVSGLVGGDAAGDVYSGTPTVGTAVTTASNAGTYVNGIAITAGSVVASDYDYQVAFADADFVVTPAELTVTAQDAAREYGEVNPAFTGTITGFKLGEDAAVLATAPGYATAATAASDVGSYAITPSGGVAANYTFDYVDGTLTVDAADLTITANDQSRDYGDANPGFDATYDGFKLSDDAAVISGLTLTTPATAASDAGSYVITAAGASATNYNITLVNGTLSVDPAPVTVTADDASRTYGAGNPAFTGEVAGLKLGQDASVLPNLGYGTTATTSSDAGTYAVTPTGATNPNYSYTYVPGTLTVNPAPLTITANNAGVAFNEPLPTFTAAYTGLVAGDTAVDLAGLTLTTTAVQGSAVGDYTITAAGATNANYDITFVNGLLTISSQILTITADDFLRLYGAPNPGFTAGITGFAGGDDASVLTSPVVFSTAAVADSSVGTYAIVPSGAVAPNYDITFVNGTLTIEPAALTITANSFSRDYGDANPTFTAAVDGLVAGDTMDAITGLVFGTAATVNSDVGDYVITPGGASNANYAISFVDGTLTVAPVALDITLDDQSREYGEANPALTSSINGFKLADDASVLTGLAPVTGAVASSDVGDYAITTGPVSATNYTVNVTPGTLTVSAAPLDVALQDQSATYGDAIPAPVANFTGFKLGQDASALNNLVLQSAPAGAGVGDYAITGSADSPNYTLTFVPGTLTINPAPLTITALDATELYGAADPVFGASFSGFVNGESVSVLGGYKINTSATVASDSTGFWLTGDVGDYALTPVVADPGNYDLTLVPGTLTIEPAPLTVTAGDATKVFADLMPEFSVSALGLRLGQSLDEVGTLALNTAAAQFSDVGAYAITPAFDGVTSANYDISFEAGTLSITPRPVTIVAHDATRDYGDANPTLTWSLQGTNPVGATNASLIDTTGLTVTTAATAASDVGDYAAVPAGVTDSNFEVSYVNGTLSIDPAALEVAVTPASASREYGLANPDFALTSTGLKLGDALEDVLTGLEITTAATTASNVGFYPVLVDGTQISSNYTVNLAGALLEVTPAPLAVAPVAASRLYGDADPAPTLTATGLRNGDTADLITASFASTATPFSGVGNYTISVTAADAPNYDVVTLGTGTLTVRPRPLTIAASDAAREYGEANPVFTATFDGLASFDDASVVSGLVLSSTATEATGVQDLAITVSGGTNGNYAITRVPGTLTITPAPLTFTVDDFTRIYGRTDPVTPDATLLDGLKLGDSFADLGVELAGPAAQADVGTYDVQVSLANPNYTVVSAPGTMQVLPAPLTVQVGNAARTYGEANPAIGTVSMNVAGLVFGQTVADVLALDWPVAVTADAGNYAITPTLLSSNYEISSASSFGNLAVLPRNLALKPANIIRTYGDENPAYDILVGGDGLADFDTIDDVAFTDLVEFDGTITPALPGVRTDAGYHSLRVVLNPNPNYAVATVPGLLAILPRPITLTVDDVLTVHDEPVPGFTTTADNVLPGDEPDFVFQGLTYGVYANNLKATLEEAPTVASVEIPVGFDDEEFRRRYPATLGDPDATFTPGGVEVTVPAELAVVVEPGDDEPSLSLIASGGVFPSNSALTAEEQAGLITYYRYIQPDPDSYVGLNPNYVVTVVNNGLLTVAPDPVVAEQLRQKEEDAGTWEREIEDKSLTEIYGDADTPITVISGADFDSLWAGSPDLVGSLVSSTLDHLFAVLDQLDASSLGALEDVLGEDTLAFPEGSLFHLITGKTVGKRSDVTPAMIAAWVAEHGSDPAYRPLLADALVDYFQGLQQRDPATWSTRNSAFAAMLSEQFEETRDEILSGMLEQESQFRQNSEAGNVYYGVRQGLDTIENRAAIAAEGFLSFESQNLSAAEIDVLTRIQAATLSSDREANVALFDEWIALRADNPERAFIDDQIDGFRAETIDLLGQLDDAEEVFMTDGGNYLEPLSTPAELYGSRVPYGEFIKDSGISVLEGKLANYDLAASLGALSAGALGGAAGAAGAATLAGGVSATTSVTGAAMTELVGVAAVIFPHASTMGALAAAPPAVIVAAAVVVGTIGGVQAFQQDEQETIFRGLTGDYGQPTSLSDLNFDTVGDPLADDYDPTPEETVTNTQQAMAHMAVLDLLGG